MPQSNFIEVVPIAGALGAEISGVDLSKEISAATFDDINCALIEYKVIFFREQNLTPKQHIRFAGLFGEAMQDQFVQEHEDYPQLMELLKEADDSGYNFGGTWHTDSSYRKEPPMGVVLYAKELPPFGGDTLWTNMELVYDNLSAGMKTLLEPLNALHLAQGFKQKLALIKGDYTKSFTEQDIVRVEQSHPVIRCHPVTGKRSLYVNDAYVYCFDGMTEAESKPLIDYLCNFAIQPAFTCRFRWQPGSLAVWDNRNTMHFAISDYHGHRRLMHRYTIAGDVPIGVKPKGAYE